jgi:glycosyltransferase involved in cell wall biosynthesis
MKLYAICLVKNEDDVIEQTLIFASRSCDRIFVIDNWSDDGTWDIVQSVARSHPQVVPFMQTREPYSDALRALAYNAYHAELDDTDWWMILDADEFLAEDPRPVIEEAIKEGADIVRAWQIQFYYTEKDYRRYAAGEDKRDVPIFERRRHYLINWQEPRLFRNQSRRMWDVRLNASVPNGLRKVARRRILNRHYQYRDPEQIEKRLKLRFGQPLFAAHVKSLDWQSALRRSKDLNYYRDGEPWRFSLSGVVYYHRKRLYYRVRGKVQQVLRRLVILDGKPSGRNR